jgi:hypothetical protein
MITKSSIFTRLYTAARIREGWLQNCGEGGSGGGNNSIISSFTVSQTEAEVGQVIANLTLNWTLNPTDDPDTSQTINQGVGVIANNLRTANTGAVDTTVGASKSWLLSIVDDGNNYSSTATIAFRRRRYWGVSTDPNLGAGAIDVLTDIPTFSNELAASRLTTKTFNCTGGRYIYMIYPDSLGAASPEWRVNGFPVTLTNVDTVALTNQYGNTVNYIVQRSDNLLNGAAISVQIL